MDFSDTILPHLLTRRAADTPDQVFLRHVDGTTLTFASLERRVGCWMATLRESGVAAGTPVVVMLPVSFDAVCAWLAVARLGGLHVAINTHYVGNMLRHVLVDSGAAHLVLHASYAARVAEIAIDLPQLRHVLLIGPPARAALPFAIGTLREDISETGSVDLDPSGIASVIYTSGTTGPSKGVLVTWRQTWETARWCMPPEDVRPEDIWYSPWPLYHVSGQLGLVSAAMTGTGLVLRDTFSTSQFWSDIRDFACTTVLLPGATLSYLANQPSRDDDADQSLRNVLAAPLPANAAELAVRFGIRFRTIFNMTEVSCPIVSGWTLPPQGSCGRVRPGAEVRIVDASDEEVPVGATGELVVRSDQPWELMAGYLNRPDATVAAWRNLWFHTGDAFRCDAEGNYYFLDRLKYTIRKGGENISSVELENEVCAYPPVLECAAIGVPSPLGEEEVKVFVVIRPNYAFDPAELIAFMETRVPRFMLPRYVMRLDNLPKTNTHRAKKEELRNLHDPNEVWDRLGQASGETAEVRR